MRKSAIPRKDDVFKNFVVNIKTQLATLYASFGVTQQQSTDYAASVTAFVNAYNITLDPTTRTKASIAGKNTTRDNCRAATSRIIKIIEGFAALTNQQREALGLNIPTPPTPSPIPEVPPILEIENVVANVINAKVHGANTPRKGMPPKVGGVSFFSYVGANPPEKLSDWKFEGNSTKGKVRLIFDQSLPAFSKVWITAQWYNTRAMVGPACVPVATNLGTWVVQAQAA